MSDDWYDKWLKNRQEQGKQKYRQTGNPADLPHYPLPDQEVDMSRLAGKVPGSLPGHIPGGNGELDAGAMLMQRMMARGVHPGAMNPMGGMNQMPQQGGGNQAQEVMLREGFEYYKEVSAGFGSPASLVKKAGIISNVAGKQFLMKRTKDCIEVTNEAIDLNNPPMDKHRRLVEVEAMWIGKILVPEQAIIHTGRTNMGHNPSGGKRMLND